MCAAVLEDAESAAAECWDGLVVHDDSRDSQGSVVPVHWVCEDVCNPGSRIQVEAAGTWRDGYDVHDDIQCSRGSVVRECVCGTDCMSGSRIPDAAADPWRDG